ncbi:MAG: hypothetical protein ABSE84_14225 [Isosphaeraceae bacterium]
MPPASFPTVGVRPSSVPTRTSSRTPQALVGDLYGHAQAIMKRKTASSTGKTI